MRVLLLSLLFAVSVQAHLVFDIHADPATQPPSPEAAVFIQAPIPQTPAQAASSSGSTGSTSGTNAGAGSNSGVTGGIYRLDVDQFFATGKKVYKNE